MRRRDRDKRDSDDEASGVEPPEGYEPPTPPPGLQPHKTFHDDDGED